MTTILLLTASPRDLSQLDLNAEANMIQDGILHRAFSDEFKIVARWHAEAGTLQQLLKDYKPDVVHFSGHGSEYGEIILEGSNHTVAPVPVQVLGKLFALHKGAIRCVVLNACYSRPQAEAIAASIPCVVGMSDVIVDQMAQRFALAFYRALADGDDVNAAFGQGALEIELQGEAAQAQVPVLLPTPNSGKGLTVVTGQRHTTAAAPVGDQERYRRLLTDFLEPLQMRLSNSKRTFDRLRADRQLDHLEQPISKLQEFFATLDDADARKSLWMIYIDRLIDENSQAVKLIEKHIGQIVLDDFRLACYEYLDHAKTWEATWKAMRSGAVSPGSSSQSPLFVAPPFPWQFDAAFQAELAEVRSRAGL